MLETDKQSRKQRPGEAGVAAVANTSEIMLAFESLEPAGLLRLRNYARFRMRALGHKAQGRTDEDLLSEAFTATLAGQRRWNPLAVDFIGHMCGAMRSISSHWAEKAGTHVELDELDMSPPAGSGWAVGETALGDLPFGMVDPERDLAARQELARIERRFADDPLVLQIIDAFAKGMKGPEIKSALGLTQTDFETAVRRLRRGVDKMEKQDERGQANG